MAADGDVGDAPGGTDAVAAGGAAVEHRVFAFGDVGLPETIALWPQGDRKLARPLTAPKERYTGITALRNPSLGAGAGRLRHLSLLGQSAEEPPPARPPLAAPPAGSPAPTPAGGGFPAATPLDSLQPYAADIVHIDSGPEHSLLLLITGDVLTWGTTQDGRLGAGAERVRRGGVVAEPLRIDCGGFVTDVAAGGAHSLALRQDGVVLSWGSNSEGQLGSGGLQSRAAPEPIVSAGLPHGCRITAVAAGRAHSVLLAASGHVYCFGRGREGQLGRPATLQCAPRLVSSISAQRVTLAAAAGHVTALRTANGAAWLCGEGLCGMLGQGNSKPQNKPRQVPFEHQVVNVSEVVSAAPPPRYGTADSFKYPKKLYVPPTVIEPSAALVDIAVGWGHAVFADHSGRVFAAGLNAKGQLGLGLTACTRLAGESGLGRPRLVRLPPPPADPAALAPTPPPPNAGGPSPARPQHADAAAKAEAAAPDAEEAGTACDSVTAGTSFSAAIADGELFLWGSLPHAAQPAAAGAHGTRVPLPRPATDLGGPSPVAVPPGAAFGCDGARVVSASVTRGSGLIVVAELPAAQQ